MKFDPVVSKPMLAPFKSPEKLSLAPRCDPFSSVSTSAEVKWPTPPTPTARVAPAFTEMFAFTHLLASAPYNADGV